jgi:stage III sporulation protein AA
MIGDQPIHLAGDRQPVPSNYEKSNDLLRFFPAEFRNLLANAFTASKRMVIEVRIRVNQPLELNFGTETALVSPSGDLVADFKKAYIIRPEDLRKILNSITTGSFYALEEEITQGYFGLPGGHRVGFTGHVLQTSGKIRLIRDISSLNFRIAKAVKGVARPLIPLLWKDGRFLKTLIISPPAAGKTTLLREIIREVSYGIPQLGIAGLHVGLVDERSEIAGSFQGVAQLDVGPRTDVLDACPKKDGVYLLLRAMNPQLIATDEIGCSGDYEVIEDIINAGVSFIGTAHALNPAEAMNRPGLKRILEMALVERLIVLSNRLGVGTIESVRVGITGPELLPSGFRPGGTHE